MNWSLMLNVLLLVGVVVAIVRTIQARKQQRDIQGATQPAAQSNFYDDIIAVRKVQETTAKKPIVSTPLRQRHTFQATSAIKFKEEASSQKPKLRANLEEHTPSMPTPEQKSNNPSFSISSSNSLMMFLLAKSNRQLAGYELLQAVLSAGFRFGEGDLFHRHQYPNGQGPVMCTLAAATPTGVFDLQNIGGLVVHGLCLFMQISGSPETDAERFDIMMDTAKTLSDSLDTHLLDDQRQPLSEQSIAKYHSRLYLFEESLLNEAVE